ncbi:hypothetical protein AB0467_05745 [Streptomyces sp. NPDC052095]|uniref:hypothetical protein n=1 Tax=unclassified Streptomyces TaxID=2593676 RepID=UPI00344CABE6
MASTSPDGGASEGTPEAPSADDLATSGLSPPDEEPLPLNTAISTPTANRTTTPPTTDNETISPARDFPGGCCCA